MPVNIIASDFLKLARTSRWYVIPGMAVAVNHYGPNPMAIIIGGVSGISAPLIFINTIGVIGFIGSAATLTCVNRAIPSHDNIISLIEIHIHPSDIILGLFEYAGPLITAGCIFWGIKNYFI